MVPPTQNLNLDIAAISGICGSISIACWIVVFSPQIIENFRRGSAEGLSLHFLIVWLAGDVFNILGAALQGVLPTMLILAVYYTLADIVLLGQCCYYYYRNRGEVVEGGVKGKRDVERNGNGNVGEPDERTGLLAPEDHHRHHPFALTNDGGLEGQQRRGSGISVSHLSPVVPLLSDSPQTTQSSSTSTPDNPQNQRCPTTRLQTLLFNLFIVLMVCSAGVMGWYISQKSNHTKHHKHHHHYDHNHPGSPDGSDTDTDLHFSLWGQIFGYVCAALYLGSRVPQLLLNYRRKSTEGVSMLFFLFACIGNLTYVLSIFAYEAKCHSGGDVGVSVGVRGRRCADGEEWRLYWRYIAVNASWLAGSLGTLFLDGAVFAQFWAYREGGAVGAV